MTELPEEIGDIQTLRRLDLSSNAITELPPQLASLPNLRILDVSVNNIGELPPALRKMPALEQLRTGMGLDQPTRNAHRENTHPNTHPRGQSQAAQPQTGSVPSSRAATVVATPRGNPVPTAPRAMLSEPLSGPPGPVNDPRFFDDDDDDTVPRAQMPTRLLRNDR